MSTDPVRSPRIARRSPRRTLSVVPETGRVVVEDEAVGQVVRRCGRASCGRDLVELGAHSRALYCSHACKVAAERARRRVRDREARSVLASVAVPVRDPFVEVSGEVSWSRLFREVAWLGDVSEARRKWDYVVAFEVAGPRPSPAAVEVADGLRLRVPPEWR